MCGVDGRQVDQGNLEGKRGKTSEKGGKEGDSAKTGGSTNNMDDMVQSLI